MSNTVTLEQLEQQVAQLPPDKQLKLVAYITDRLSAMPLTPPRGGDEESLRQQREKEADELIALCDAAAEMWVGEFDSAADLRHIRDEG